METIKCFMKRESRFQQAQDMHAFGFFCHQMKPSKPILLQLAFEARVQFLVKPQTVILKGAEAVETLNNYVNELKEGSTQQLTEEQAKAMIKVAEGLIQTIQNGAPAPEDTKKGTLLLRLADTMRKLISREPAHESIPPPRSSPTSTHHPSTKERARARKT